MPFIVGARDLPEFIAVCQSASCARRSPRTRAFGHPCSGIPARRAPSAVRQRLASPRPLRAVRSGNGGVRTRARQRGVQAGGGWRGRRGLARWKGAFFPGRAQRVPATRGALGDNDTRHARARPWGRTRAPALRRRPRVGAPSNVPSCNSLAGREAARLFVKVIFAPRWGRLSHPGARGMPVGGVVLRTRR